MAETHLPSCQTLKIWRLAHHMIHLFSARAHDLFSALVGRCHGLAAIRRTILHAPGLRRSLVEHRQVEVLLVNVREHQSFHSFALFGKVGGSWPECLGCLSEVCLLAAILYCNFLEARLVGGAIGGVSHFVLLLGREQFLSEGSQSSCNERGVLLVPESRPRCGALVALAYVGSA